MAKCKKEAWQADPNYILRRCEFPSSVEFDVLDPSLPEPEPGSSGEGQAAEMLLKKGGDRLAVGFVAVAPKYREKRWGTRLYEEALRESCATGKPLSSDTQRSEFSEAFWRKQERKGRARCIGEGGAYWAKPRYDLEDMLDNDEITASDYERMTRELPEPETTEEGNRYWPCLRHEMTQNPCPGGFSLDAIRPARKKPARKAVKRRRR